MDLLLKQFGSLSSAEVVWLEDLYSFTQKHLLPVARNAAPELPLALLNLVQELVNQNIASKEGGSVLPISYRFISISELIHVQNKPCCSHLMWSTKDFKEWAKKGENLVPDHKALSRANLILVGCLTGYCEDQLQQVYDGSLNIRDGSGTIFCEVLNPKLEWLDALMLFPGWIFIPQGPDYFGRKVGSYLEITERPLPIVTSLNASILPEPGIVSALDSNNAYWLLMHKNKWHGLKIAVFGTLSHLCPVLKIQDKTFFYFRLQESLAENSSTVPVVVTECRKLCWHYFLQVGEGYLITALRICFLKTTGQRLFCITPESHFWPLDSAPQISKISWKLVMHSSKERIPELKEEQETPIEELPESQSLLKENCKQTCQRKKISKVISYKGVITRVLNSAAGLFELDREVGLCLAYQQLVNGGRGLRPGAKIELHHVHFLYCRTEGFPSAMLSCCLHSTVKVAEFSSLESEFQPFTHDKNLYIHALVKGELGLPEYMWLCRTITSLSDRFCPKYVKPVQMASSWNGVAGRFLRASLIIKEANHIHSRDIYREMLGYPHHCPLQEYNTFTPSWHVPPIADLKTMIESQGWQSLSLTSLPPRAKLQHLTSSELNINLSWSIYTYSSQNLKIPVVLVGVLKSTYRSSCLQLVDQTGELDCVIVQKSLKGGDTTALKETSWSGCLLMIKEFTLVMERFLKTNFPSWKQLEDPKFVQEKKSRSVSCLVSFTCVITERISLENENKPLSASLLQDTKQGVPSEECLKIRLTVRDTELSYQTLHIYMDFSQICYIPGLVPGAHICFYRLERKISRFNTVYCSYGTLSSLTIMGYHFLGNNATDHYNTTSALVHLGDWASGLQNWRQGRVLCHVTCVLSLELKWMCSLCSAIFKQGHCTRDNPVCNSENGIFSSEAKIVVEDGTGEAQVLFSDDIISELLHLSASEWDGLQKLIRVRGHVKYINLGRSAEHWVTEECEDVLLHFLSALCSSSHVCRALILTCKMTPWCKSTEQRIKLANLKRFCRGDREYLTKIPSPLLLDCESLQEADGLALQELQKDHLASSYQRTSIANHS
ncbi:CST complex subunit CTC1 isoform X3 [Polypterus senegalus]|uniref:CST complex subunit CTC1 isoform X3 n=1 Tax=Polypterus senegalus TaxID=55291 RepID=UPI0019668C59|nr:CST complex subunit CTC1 isoform X3 [Polypterus senegalus]